MVRTLLKTLFVLSVFFVAAWVLVVGYWQFSGTDPAAADLALYLVCLPVGLCLVFLAGKAVSAWRRRRQAPESGPNPDASFGNAADADDDPDGNLSLSLVDAALRLPIGSDSRDALSVLAEGRTRPGLDAQLVDDQGFPIFAARVDDLIDDDLTDTLALPSQHAEQALVWSADQQRALALAGEALMQLLAGALSGIMPLYDSATEADGGAPGATADTAPLRLQVVALLPAHWSTVHRDAACRWLQQQIEQAGVSLPPFAVRPQANGIGTQSFLFLNELARLAEHQQVEQLCLLLACDSAISEVRIAQLDGAGQLFSQANPGGLIATEGATGLLLASNLLADRLAAPNSVRLHHAALEKHDMAATRKARAAGDLLRTLVRKALINAERDALDICGILTDAGKDRALESSAVTNDAVAHLDHASECLDLGTACGDLGPAATLAALALARAQATSEKAPFLVLGLQHNDDRAALVVGPTAL